jgi:hypothetical protein
VFVGSYFGFKKPAAEDPVRTNKIPRQIPEQPWYMHPVFSCLVGGVLPFGAGERRGGVWAVDAVACVSALAGLRAQVSKQEAL